MVIEEEEVEPFAVKLMSKFRSCCGRTVDKVILRSTSSGGVRSSILYLYLQRPPPFFLMSSIRLIPWEDNDAGARRLFVCFKSHISRLEKGP